MPPYAVPGLRTMGTDGGGAVAMASADLPDHPGKMCRICPVCSTAFRG